MPRGGRRKRSSSSTSSRSRRQRIEEGEPDEVEDQGVDDAGETGAGARRGGNWRREQMREIAESQAARLARPEKRRVVKLAHADAKKSAVSSTPFGVHRSSLARYEEENNGEDGDGWCGPFSVARQIIAKREETKRKREEEERQERESHHPLDQLMEEFDKEQQKKVRPSLSWKGQLPDSTPSSLYAKRQRRVDLSRRHRTIPSLYQLCVDFVVANFEHVESLGDVGNDIRVSISKELVARNKFDATAFAALIESNMETLEIIDCAGIPQEIMAKTVSTLTDLRYLLLTHAGRCFGPTTVQALIDKSKAPLCCISIAGAYLLTDDDAARLIESTSSTLQSLEFNTCPLLGDKTCTAIQAHGHNLLELSLQELGGFAGKGACWSNLAIATSKTLQQLQSLKLVSMPGLTDSILSSFLQAAGSSLGSLNVCQNLDLTDETLSAIRQHSPKLRSLDLSGLKELSAPGLETLFTYDLAGLPPPPKLKVLKLSGIDHQAVTDELMELVSAASAKTNLQPIGDTTPAAATSSPYFARYPRGGGGGSSVGGTGGGGGAAAAGGGLVHLDIQGSTTVTDAALEHLVVTCASSLEELNVGYCPLLTDQGLGYLVSKAGTQLTKIYCWGCAQLSDEFLDGHDRSQDETFEIIGAWMKKSGTRFLR